MADMTSVFPIKEDEEPMATEPIYLSSDESEFSTPSTTPDHELECIYPDSINQLKASQLEQRSAATNWLTNRKKSGNRLTHKEQK